MSKPNIIVINLSTSGSRLGGAAIAAEWHSRFMARQYPLELWRMWDNDLETQLDNLKIRNFLTKDGLEFWGQFLPRQAKAIFLTSDILEQILLLRPQIIHLQNPLPALAFQKIAEQASKHGIKVVASTHGFFEVMNPYQLNFFQKRIWRKFITDPILNSLKYIDAILSGYPLEKQVLLSLGVPDSKIHLVPNGINPFFWEQPDPEDLERVLQKYQMKTDKPILLFIGNHTPNKGLSTVMRIAENISTPATFVIGGKLIHPDEPSYWLQKIRLREDIQLIFTDYLSLPEQRAFLHLSSLLLFPSLSDTLPLTIIEAMASGLPVIAYGVGGIPFQLDNEAGIVVPPGDFSAFADAVESMLESRQQRQKISQNAKLRQENYFSWEISARKTLDIYHKLLDN